VDRSRARDRPRSGVRGSGSRGCRGLLEPLPHPARHGERGRGALISEEAVLQRIRLRSVAIAAAAAIGALFFGWRAAVSLTIAAAVVIFSFLVLEKLTERLVPPQEKKGLKAVLPLLLVTAAGAVLLGVALLRWRGFEPVAGMAGLSVVVVAIVLELLRGGRGESA